MKKLIGVFAVILFLAAGCTTTRITSSWKAQNTVPQKYNKILVLGLIRETDRSLQENMENHFAEDLREQGYQAVTSLQEYGPKYFENMDEETAVSKLKNSGIDAVVTIVLLDKEKKRDMWPAIPSIHPTAITITASGVTGAPFTAGFMNPDTI
ncbi:MAG: hypothetical protein IPP93_08700 [Chitinophagaceae bacterium]|nr:hypothetical protein [Chitinophagaceae bacterium]